MIDFSATQQGKDETVIEFVNHNSEVVKTYQLSELEDYVLSKRLNISYEHDSVGGTGMVCDPNTDFVEREVHVLPADYIDDNWDEVTEKFYNFKNPNEYKANGHPNQLNSKKL